MLHDVVGATYQNAYRIELEFDDGARGVVDFSKYLERGGVFERFNDIKFFRSFVLSEELGVITWGEEVDIAPETLYAEATGRGLPAWVETEEETTAKQRLQQDRSRAASR